MNEREFEDIICKYPDLIETGLLFKGRQVTVRGLRIDMLFEDKHGQKLIVELKQGTIRREHVAQLLDYEGHVLSPDDPTVRVMLVGNRVPENLRRALDHHGFEWRELLFSFIKDFLEKNNDEDYLRYFSIDEPLKKNIGQIDQLPYSNDKQITQTSIKQTLPPGAKHGFLEPKHALENLLNRLSSELRPLFFEFHNQLMSSISRGIPAPRTHDRGVTYRCTEKKAFIYVNFNNRSISLNYYTGSGNIKGLDKTTWSSGNDRKGGLFNIRSHADISHAVEYAKQAYRIALSES
jgi:hypothetical protein